MGIKASLNMIPYKTIIKAFFSYGLVFHSQGWRAYKMYL